MSLQDAVGKFAIQSLTHEQAYDRAERLQDRQKEETDNMTVFSGIDAELGPVYIVVPPLGDSILLPSNLHPIPVAFRKLD
jgi:hypothetical protein